jgi:hypothetical protein
LLQVQAARTPAARCAPPSRSHTGGALRAVEPRDADLGSMIVWLIWYAMREKSTT